MKIIAFYKYYFSIIRLLICYCLIALSYMINQPILIWIGYIQILVLPNPESYKEIEERVGYL